MRAWSQNLLLIGCLAASTACLGNPWNRYDDSLYDALKYATPEALEDHLGLLGDIVDDADKEEINPPPGVLAEYGFFLLEKGESEKGLEMLEREARLFPESTAFVDVLKRAGSGEGSLFEEASEDSP